MVWLASSVWRRRRVAYCGLGPPGWGVSMTRLPSPGWSFGMPSGSARNCLQRNRPFRLSAAGAVIWRRLLVTPSFTTRLYGRCAIFLKATWSASSMESFLSWKPVLCAAIWCRGWTDRNIMCFSTYSALCVSWFGRRERRNSEDESFPSQTLVAFFKHQIKVKIRSERKRLSSLEFGERWVTVARLCRVVGANLIFTLDIPGT